jgi:hypothetical protein
MLPCAACFAMPDLFSDFFETNVYDFKLSFKQQEH